MVMGTGRSERMATTTDMKTSDIEIGTGCSDNSDKTSERVQSLWDYVPCITQQHVGTVSSTDVDSNEKESVPSDVPVQAPSLPVVAPSESFFDDSKPPPMAIPVSTSDTDDDDDELNQISLDQRHTDPFAPREGRTLCWRNVNMTLVSFSCIFDATSDFQSMIH